MNKDTSYVGFYVGILVSLILTTAFWTTSDSYLKGKHAFKLIEECQKELKRTESCVIVAVPKNKGE